MGKDMKSVVKSTATHKGVSLSKVREIKKLYGEMQSLFLAALEKAIRMGEILVDIKEELPYGQFQTWVNNAGLPFKASTARLYMQLYHRKDEIEAAGIQGVKEARNFLSSGGTLEDEERQPVGVLETPTITQTTSIEAASGEITVYDEDELLSVKLTARERDLANAIVAAGADRNATERGIKAKKMADAQERKRRAEERKQKHQQIETHKEDVAEITIPKKTLARFRRIARSSGRPITELLEEAADTLAKRQKK